MNDQELVNSVLNGDAKAIRELVDRFQPLVLRTAMGYAGDPEDARDITQEVLIRVITRLSDFKGRSALSTWVYRISVNHSISYLKKNRRRKLNRSLSEPSEDAGNTSPLQVADPDPAMRPDHGLISQDRSRRLHQAIDSLPAAQRTAFILLEYEELSYKEIAEVMKLSTSAVESLLFRARRKLQQKLWDCYRNKS